MTVSHSTYVNKERFLAACVPFAILALVTMIPFRKVLFGGEVFFFADIATQNYPWKQFFAAQIRELQLPLWFPYMHSGFPLYAEIQAGTFYPPNWIAFYLLPDRLAYGILMALHLFLAACFAYLYGRELGLGKNSSMVTALVFSTGAFFVVHLVHLAMFITAAWLPVEFYFLEKALKRDSPLYILVSMTPIVSLQVLAGHPQIVSYSLLALSLYLVSHASKEARCGKARPMFRMLVSFAASVSLGVVLSGIQVLPTLELINQSARHGGVELEFASEQSMPPWALVTYLFPDFFGYATPQENVDYWLFGINYWELCPYVGIPTLIFGVLPLLRRPVGRMTVFYFLLGLSLILMMGDHTPLYGVLRLIPPFGYFRAPARFSLLATFSLSILAGRGLEILQHDVQRGGRVLLSRANLVARSLFVGTLTGVMGGFGALHLFRDSIREFFLRYGETFIQEHIYNKKLFFKPLEYYMDRLSWAVDTGMDSLYKSLNPLEPRVLVCIVAMGLVVTLLTLLHRRTIQAGSFSALCIILLLCDLLVFGLRFNTSMPTDRALSPPSVVQFLRQDTGPYRVFRDIRCAQMDIESEKELLPVSMGGVWGISSADEFTPLKFKRYEEMLDIITRDRTYIVEGEISHVNLLSLLNVKYILSCQGIRNSTLTEVYRNGVFRVYRNETVLPRWFFVTRYRVIEDPAAMRSVLEDPSFDFATTVILEEQPPFAGRGSLLGAEHASVMSEAYGAHYVELEVRSGSEGMLVLGEAYYPGWRAWVNDTPATIYRADYVYQGVYLKSGTHTVRFEYVPNYLRHGALSSLSGMTVLGVIIGMVVFKKTRMRSNSLR